MSCIILFCTMYDMLHWYIVIKWYATRVLTSDEILIFSASFGLSLALTDEPVSTLASQTSDGTHAKVLFFRLRLSFFATFLCILRLDAKAGLLAACTARVVLRSRRTPRTLCRIRLYTSANLVVPALLCTSSCSSTDNVLSSSNDGTLTYEHKSLFDILTHLGFSNSVIFSDAVNWRQNMHQELLDLRGIQK